MRQYETLLSGTLRDLLGQLSRECEDLDGNLVCAIFQFDQFLVAPNPHLTEGEKEILVGTLLPAIETAT